MMRAILALGLLLISASSAQAATITGTTWAEPEEYTVSYDARIEDGQVVRDPQTFTMHWDLSLDCTPGTEPGGDFEIFAANTGRIAATEDGEEWVIFDLEPKSFMASWQQASALDPWTSSGSMNITIVNEQASDVDRNITYFWAANPFISDACTGGQELDGELDFRNHTIFLPKVGGDDSDVIVDEPRNTPGAALPLILVGIALAAFKKR